MKPLFILSLLSSLILSSCGGAADLDQYLVDLSNFNIDNNALKDGEKVRIIGASGNITNDDEMDFYNLIVVESLETGKIVNVLMIDYIFVDENNRDLNFISFDTPTGKLSAVAFNDDKALKVGEKIQDIEIPTFDKVLYDTEYLDADIYQYPTIIGGLGVVTHDKKEVFESLDQLKDDPTKKNLDSLIR